MVWIWPKGFAVNVGSILGEKKTKIKKGAYIMFSAGLLLTAGATVVIAIADKVLEETGIHWLGTVLKIAVPLTLMILAVYFLQTNPINWWLR